MSQENVWPHWFYGPNGESGIFHSAESVPAGWSRFQGQAVAVDDQPQLGIDTEQAPRRRGRPPRVNPGEF